MVSCEAFGSTGWKLLTVSRVGEHSWAPPAPSRNGVGELRWAPPAASKGQWESSGGYSQLHQRTVGAALWSIVGEGISEGVVLCCVEQATFSQNQRLNSHIWF